MLNLEVTMQDVQVLVEQSPLFAAQLQNIVLMRKLREQKEELDKLRNGAKAQVDADTGKD